MDHNVHRQARMGSSVLINCAWYYSGIENPLFDKENTRMYYGNAKASLDKLLTQIS